jgi:hypothetical protein
MTTENEISRRAFLRRFGIGVAGIGALTVLPGGGRAFAATATAPPPGPLATPSTATGAGIPATTGPLEMSHFGRMFPRLPPWAAGIEPEAVIADFVTLTSSGANPATPTAGTSAPMVEPGGSDDTLNGAVFTYLGQFALGHDLTLDPTPQPSAPVHPANVPNYETFRLDLSSLYGGGPLVSPQMYDGAKFITQLNSNGVPDLPRRSDGSAIIVELRNDQHEIISQLHYAFEQFHNAVVNLIDTGQLAQIVNTTGFLGQEFLFSTAAPVVRQYYQWIILHQWLPQIIGQNVVDGLLNGSIPRFYNPGPNPYAPMTPVEWSIGANRLHSMVRNAYAINLVTDHYPNSRTILFNGADGTTGANDLHGGRPLPASNVIDWGNFVNELARGGFNPTQPGTSFLQVYKQIIPQLGASSFLLPVGGQSGAAASGSNNLAFRDLIRSYFYGVPSGQEVAAALGNPVIDPSVLLESLPTPIDPASVPTLQTATPLWLYVLAEAYIAESAAGARNGFAAYLQPNKAGTFQPDHLGPTGARIIGDVVLKLLEIDPNGILNPNVNFTPSPPIAPTPGQFGIADLLVTAGVASYP